MQRLSVKSIFAAAVVAAGLLHGAAAAELPTYEVSSFPATPVQISLTGSAGVQEQATAPTLTQNGMPASPAQLAVLAPHHHSTVRASNETTVGNARD